MFWLANPILSYLCSLKLYSFTLYMHIMVYVCTWELIYVCVTHVARGQSQEWCLGVTHLVF